MPLASVNTHKAAWKVRSSQMELSLTQWLPNRSSCVRSCHSADSLQPASTCPPCWVSQPCNPVILFSGPTIDSAASRLEQLCWGVPPSRTLAAGIHPSGPLGLSALLPCYPAHEPTGDSAASRQASCSSAQLERPSDLPTESVTTQLLRSSPLPAALTSTESTGNRFIVK